MVSINSYFEESTEKFLRRYWNNSKYSGNKQFFRLSRNEKKYVVSLSGGSGPRSIFWGWLPREHCTSSNEWKIRVKFFHNPQSRDNENCSYKSNCHSRRSFSSIGRAFLILEGVQEFGFLQNGVRVGLRIPKYKRRPGHPSFSDYRSMSPLAILQKPLHCGYGLSRQTNASSGCPPVLATGMVTWPLISS